MYLKLRYHMATHTYMEAEILHEALSIQDPVDLWTAEVISRNQFLPHEDLILQRNHEPGRRFSLFFNQPATTLIALTEHRSREGKPPQMDKDCAFHFYSLARELLPFGNEVQRISSEGILRALRAGNVIDFQQAIQWRSFGGDLLDIASVRHFCVQNLWHAHYLHHYLDILSGTKEGVFVLSDKDNTLFFPGEVAVIANCDPYDPSCMIRGETVQQARQYIMAYLALLKFERNHLKQAYRHLCLPSEGHNPEDLRTTHIDTGETLEPVVVARKQRASAT